MSKTRPAKGWPKDICKPASYEELVDPVVDGIRATHSISRKDERKSVPWKGVAEVGATGRACSYTISKQILSKDMLAYHEERGRDLLHVLVMMAVSIGIEQGRRIEREICLKNGIFLCSDDAKLGFTEKQMRKWLEEWSH